MNSPEVARFLSEHIEVCPRQVFGPNTNSRLYQIESLNRETVMRGMIPGSLFGYDAEGAYWDVLQDRDKLLLQQGATSIVIGTVRDGNLEDFYFEKASFLEGAFVIPVASWGAKFDIMQMDLSKAPLIALHDLSRNIRDITSETTANILMQRMNETEEPVYTGANYAGGSLYGKNLQSILFAHFHNWQFSDENSGLTPSGIQRARASNRWDDGLSLSVGTAISEDLIRYVLPHWGNAAIKPDNQGFTIELPGFSPYDFANPDFTDYFWKAMAMTVFNHLNGLHQQMFNSNMGEIASFVNAAHQTGTINEEQYRSFFQPSYSHSSSAELKQLKKLQSEGILHEFFGWAGGVQFTREGALIGVNLGFMDIPMGPVEALGVQLIRPAHKIYSPELEAKYAPYRQRTHLAHAA